MAVIGLALVIIAAIVALATGLANSGSDHAVEAFSMLGIDTAASSGRIFIYGVVTGVAGMFGLDLLLAAMGRGVKRRSRNRREQKQRQSTSLTERIQEDPSSVAIDEIDMRDATGKKLTH